MKKIFASAFIYQLLFFCFYYSELYSQVPTTPCGSAYYCGGSSAAILNIKNQQPIYCVGEPVTFDFVGATCGSDYIEMGDNCGLTNWPSAYFPVQNTIVHIYNQPGTYTVNVFNQSASCYYAITTITISECDNDNNKCQGGFSPIAGDYILSFWVREDLVNPGNVSSYSSGIQVNIGTTTGPNVINVYANQSFNASNKIIDGWQKVETTITLPANYTSLELSLKNQVSVPVYFDDIRFHPFNSSFKSYVYDPVTLRLVAELDDRNYATFYEYDEEGQLIRVKKETERGIKTIKESRTSVNKK